MKKTLVIMAAGIGSRFGGGIKQLEPVGPNGEIIMDYSIHDAVAAGFKKIVFIIRRDIEADFKEVIGDRISAVCGKLGVEVAYAFQEISEVPSLVDSILAPKEVPEKLESVLQFVQDSRTKPLGTGHAILACDGLIDGPFAVINADDYYGKDGFRKAAEFLGGSGGSGEATGLVDAACGAGGSAGSGYGLVGYILKNTLSDNGGVTRGICKVGASGELVGIDETKDIVKVADGSAESNGVEIDANSLVSMNFWCYPAGFMDILKREFPDFLMRMKDPMKDEFLLPIVVDELIKQGTEVTVIPTDDKWFGVTYKEDKASVVESFRELYAGGVYSDDLYADLC